MCSQNQDIDNFILKKQTIQLDNITSINEFLENFKQRCLPILAELNINKETKLLLYSMPTWRIIISGNNIYPFNPKTEQINIKYMMEKLHINETDAKNLTNLFETLRNY